MALHLYRSNRVERLVEALADLLPALRPADPFVPLPIVVGSRAMARWLAHEIATRRSVAAGIVYPLPRRGILAAIRAALDGSRLDAHLDAPDRFEPDALALRLLPLLHDAREGACAAFRPSITTKEDDGALVADWPALAFAREVADVLDRLLHEAPQHALAWARGERMPHRHAWLAHLLGKLGVADAGSESPAAVFEALDRRAATGEGSGGPLILFGLSTLGPGDRARIARLAAAMEVHLFSVVPTPHHFVPGRTGDGDSSGENPVLASLGRASRALVDLVTEAEAKVPIHERDRFEEGPPEPAHLLGRLQAWIAEAAPLPDAEEGPWPVDPPDRSVAFHAAPGALRQCEVVREILLEAFAEDPTLMPRDVVIQTPDPATYAPLMALVLQRAGIETRGDARRRCFDPIPAVAADLGLREQNVVAEILLRLLALGTGRITASAVAELLALEPVQRALGIDPEAAEAAGELLASSGFTWGGCAEDRKRLLERFAADEKATPIVPETVDDQFTARFAAERLALGICQHDPGPPWAHEGASAPHVGIAPVALEGNAQAAAAAALVLALERLDALHHAFQTPRTVEDWVGLFSATLDLWCDLPADRAFLRREVDDVLDAYRTLAEGADVLLAADAVAAYLEGRFDRPVRGDRPVTGAVTISGLEPMRVVPFRMVVLLGMDDGAFPRTDTRPSFDPLASGAGGTSMPQVLSRADVDRHILLEAILSARERLVVTFCGRDPRSNERLPACVPVEELLSVVGALTGRGRDDLVVEHPLQPYAPRAFVEGPTQSADPQFAAIAERLAAIAAGDGAAGDPTTGLHGAYDRIELPAPGQVPTYTVRELVSWLYRPVKQLVERRLDLRTFDADLSLSDLDPEVPKLDEGTLREILSAMVAGGTDLETYVAQLATRLAAEGRVPAGGATRGLLENATAQVEEIHRQHLREVDAPKSAALPVALDFGALGRIVDEWHGWIVRKDGSCTAAWPILWKQEPSEWDRLEGMVWLHVLARHGAALDGVKLLACKSSKAWKLPSQDAADAVLRDLLEIAAKAHVRPLPLFPNMSEAIANKLVGGPRTHAKYKNKTVDEVLRGLAAGTLPGAGDPKRVTEIAKAASSAYFGSGSDRFNGDLGDPAVALVFDGYDPARRIRRLDCEEVRLALRVWGRVRTLNLPGTKSPAGNEGTANESAAKSPAGTKGSASKGTKKKSPAKNEGATKSPAGNDGAASKGAKKFPGGRP